MALKKCRKRYTGIADLEEGSVKLYHLVIEDFPGISFETNIGGKGKIKIASEDIIDHRGKLRLDQNDGTKVPTAQLGDGVADDTKFLRGDQTWQEVEGGAPDDAKYIIQEANASLPNAVIIPGFGAHADIPPASPNLLDDEFNSSVLDPKWTILNPGKITYDINTTFKSHYYAVHDVILINDTYAGIYQPISGNFEIRAKVSVGGIWAGTACNAGLMIGEATPGKFFMIQIHIATPSIQVSYYNSPTSWNSNKVAFPAGGINFAYFRIIKSGNTVEWYVGYDGLNWVRIYTDDISGYFTVGSCGVIGTPPNNNGNLFLVCDWFRKE